jgi:trimeric autotransporter adhesin
VSAHVRHLCRTAAIALVVSAIGLLAAVMDASAYYTATGRASATASVAALGAPAITRTSTASGSATLTWSTVTAPGAGAVTYYVSRDGGAASAACPSAAAPTSATSCTDTGLSAGPHSYTVTAVWRSWTHASAAAGVTLASGAVARLVFATQPGGGATGGTAFPTQPVVTAQDSAGNAVSDYSGTVSLSIASGTGAAGATLSGCTGTLRNGVTSFSGCQLDKAGTAYALQASDRALGLSVTSAAFNVTAGAATRLVFTTQPGGGATGGTAFPTQPVVTAQDAGGNTATGYAGTLTLTIASGGTAGATLSGCTGTARSGVTSFSGCKIDKPGTGYVLQASDRTLSATSAAFDVTAAAATRLVFATQPGGGATGGTAFPTQPVVTAQDAGGNTATGYSGTVTLSIASGGTAGAALSGCTGTARSGVVTFSGCKIDKTGTGYVLQARDSTLSVTSSAFDVTAGAAASLVFTTQPGGASANNAFTTQPVVTAFDAGGNVATGYAGTVGLTLVAGTGGGALGACSASLRNGVTAFTRCKINKSGTGYVLRASDTVLLVDSNPFNVS